MPKKSTTNKTMPIQTDKLLTGKDSERVKAAMQQFKNAYATGYRLLMKDASASDKQSTNRDNSLKMLDSVESFTQFLFDGKPIAEMLGYSDKEITKFYDIASRMMNEKRYNDAKEAFFFLVTIAPNRSEFWLGLGYAYGKCEELEGALRAYVRVLELSPHRLEGYLGFAQLFTTLQDYANARKVCDMGLKFAAANKEESWAAELSDRLKKTKQQINELAKV